MALQGGQQFLTAHIPELERPVVTAGGQGLAIRTKGDGIDRRTMAFEGGQQFALSQHPRA